MHFPFHIFPKTGFINSQFQFVTNQDNLTIKVYQEDNFVGTVNLDANSSTTLIKLDKPGKYYAKCHVDGIDYIQEFMIQNVWMLGSSTLAYAQVFDDIPYAFIVMKDRLLIYDEVKDMTYKEYLISPSNIIKLQNNCVLFTKVYYNKSIKMLDLAIYDLNSFNFLAELKNKYSSIYFAPEQNLLWLYDIYENSIICFFVFDNQKKTFVEKSKYNDFNRYHICNNQLLLIECENEITIVDLINIKEHKVPKNDNILIDLYGNTYRILDNKLEVFSFKLQKFVIVKRPEKIRYKSDSAYFIGNGFKEELDLPNIDAIFKTTKDDIKIDLNNRVVQTNSLEHQFFLTSEGVFCVYKELIQMLCAIKFTKKDDEWISIPDYKYEEKYYVSYLNKDGEKFLFETETMGTTLFQSLLAEKYFHPFLAIYYKGDRKTITPEGTLLEGKLKEYYEQNRKKIVITENNNKHIIYKFVENYEIIEKDIVILNLDYIKQTNVIWYKSVDDSENKDEIYGLRLYDFEKISYIKDAYLHFKSNYIIDGHKVIDARSGELLFNFIGDLLNISLEKRKYLCKRDNVLLLNKINKYGNYELKEINFNYEFYSEAFLSPNGSFIILKQDINKYMYYDIKNDRIINFLSGNFLRFTPKGEFIVERANEKRKIKIIDPITFQEITPENYKYYRFMSPDGSLFASTSRTCRYDDIISGQEISFPEIKILKNKFDMPLGQMDIHQQVKQNREEYFEQNKEILKNYNILKAEEINSQKLYIEKQYLFVGICNSDQTVEVELPVDLLYFNYAAFSYDNQYLGIVGKPGTNGYVKIIKLKYCHKTNSLDIDTEVVFESRYPAMAAWICGFSKDGHFATYDSSPTTYLIGVSDEIFYKISFDENRGRLIYSPNKYENDEYWLSLHGSSFLCFSPTGRLMALSEQGYSAMSLGGIGHWPSKVVKLATISNSKNIDVIKEYTGFGDSVVENHQKNVTFCAFSDDETKLMVLTKDGVVTVHDIAEDLLSAGYELVN